VKLTAQNDQTEIEWEKLSPSERLAMDALGKKFDIVFAGDAGKIVIARPIDKIESVLVKAMKRGRKLLTAVTFQNGRVEEVHRTAEGELKVEKKEGAKAAVTVAEPTRGCPIPEFERADVRATRVLRTFLTPQQLADFDRTQSFLCTGADSGHQYVLTSRQAPRDRLAKVGGRSVYDATTGVAVCVHDWVVPAAEELLALKLFLELPERETFVNMLPVPVHPLFAAM